MNRYRCPAFHDSNQPSQRRGTTASTRSARRRRVTKPSQERNDEFTIATLAYRHCIAAVAEGEGGDQHVSVPKCADDRRSAGRQWVFAFERNPPGGAQRAKYERAEPADQHSQRSPAHELLLPAWTRARDQTSLPSVQKVRRAWRRSSSNTAGVRSVPSASVKEREYAHVELSSRNTPEEYCLPSVGHPSDAVGVVRLLAVARFAGEVDRPQEPHGRISTRAIHEPPLADRRGHHRAVQNYASFRPAPVE